MKRIIIIAYLMTMVISCGFLGGGGGDLNSSETSTEAKFVHIDISDATGLLTMESTSSTVSSESVGISASIAKAESDGSSGVVTSKSGIQKITSSGEIVDAMRIFTKETDEEYTEAGTEGLEKSRIDSHPSISYIGITRKKDIFVIFSRCFIYRDKAIIDGSEVDIQSYRDPWSCESPFTCQIFKINKKTTDVVSSDRIQSSNLTCLTNTLEANTWDPRTGRGQTDNSGNFYFSAHIPGNWKNVLLKYDAETGKLTEKINANICFRDFLVTGGGGILLTGVNSNGSDCSGTSFFRYISPTDKLVEITRDWWEFGFKYIENGTYAGQIIYYGPDSAANVPGWDSACLRRIDPDATDADATDGVDDRVTLLAECRNDMWNWINGAADAATEEARCIATKYLFGSGEVPKKILVANLDSDTKQEAYIVGTVHYKEAGTWIDATTDWCQQSANLWYLEYKALAKISNLDGGTDPTDNVSLLSDTTESVTNAWIVNVDGTERLFYSSTIAGIYYVKEHVIASATNVTLLTGIEAYELSISPTDSARIFISGLRFSDNKYVVGDFNPDASSVEGSLSIKDQITGVVKTIVLF